MKHPEYVFSLKTLREQGHPLKVGTLVKLTGLDDEHAHYPMCQTVNGVQYSVGCGGEIKSGEVYQGGSILITD